MKSRPRDRARVGEREQRRQHRHRGVAAERVAAVVEVERVGRRAVDERRIGDGEACRGAEHQRRAGRGGDPPHDARARLDRAGERHPDGVEDADLRPFHRGVGQPVVAQRADALGECGDDRHRRFPSEVRSIEVRSDRTLTSFISSMIRPKSLQLFGIIALDFEHDLVRKVCNFSGSCSSGAARPCRRTRPADRGIGRSSCRPALPSGR